MRAGTDGSAQGANQLSASRRKKGTTGIATKGNKPAEKLWNSTVLTHGTKLDQYQNGGEEKKERRRLKISKSAFCGKQKKEKIPHKKTQNCRQLVMCDTANLPIIQLASKHRASTADTDTVNL